MNKQETNKILAMIAAVYPSINKDRGPDLLSEIWHNAFESVPFEIMNRAVVAFFVRDTKGFPPVPGMINAIIAETIEMNEITEEEAWELVSHAASRGTYNSREEFNRLPDKVKEIVHSPQQLYDWAQLDANTFNTIVAAEFRRTWRTRQQKKKEMGIFLPSSESDKLTEE